MYFCERVGVPSWTPFGSRSLCLQAALIKEARKAVTAAEEELEKAISGDESSDERAKKIRKVAEVQSFALLASRFFALCMLSFLCQR